MCKSLWKKEVTKLIFTELLSNTDPTFNKITKTSQPKLIQKIFNELNSLLTHMNTLFFNYLKLLFNKCLASIPISVKSENAYCAKKSSHFHHLSLLQVSQCLPFVVIRLNVLYKGNSCEISYDRPSNRSPYFISLGLHEKFVAFICQLMESYFRFVFVFLFQYFRLSLTFSFMFKIRVVKHVPLFSSLIYNCLASALSLSLIFSRCSSI